MRTKNIINTNYMACWFTEALLTVDITFPMFEMSFMNQIGTRASRKPGSNRQKFVKIRLTKRAIKNNKNLRVKNPLWSRLKTRICTTDGLKSMTMWLLPSMFQNWHSNIKVVSLLTFSFTEGKEHTLIRTSLSFHHILKGQSWKSTKLLITKGQSTKMKNCISLWI